MPTLVEKTQFKSDSETEPGGKNSRLAALLDGNWNRFDIVRIERIEIGSNKGWKVWKVTYRE